LPAVRAVDSLVVARAGFEVQSPPLEAAEVWNQRLLQQVVSHTQSQLAVAVLERHRQVCLRLQGQTVLHQVLLVATSQQFQVSPAVVEVDCQLPKETDGSVDQVVAQAH
jgi:hypothetical protein